ncbi:MAG: phosphatidylglycerophosphatase A [Candidatus Abyssubacteria bacterium]
MHEHTTTTAGRGWRDYTLLGFVSVFFLGYVPVASGTFGSLPAILFAWWLRNSQAYLLASALVLFALGVAAASQVEAILGRKDPSIVTIDEFVGMLLAFFGISMTWGSVACAFFLYRAFDVFKPFPARQCERLHGGLGIMADDIVAGIYANLAVRLILLVGAKLSLFG